MGNNLNEASYCCKSRIETKNRASYPNSATHEQVVPYNSKSMTQEPNGLSQNNINIILSSLLSEKAEHTQTRTLQASSCIYHDYSTVKSFTFKVNKIPTFPQKFHQIFSEPNLERIITWLPNGRAFKIKDPRIFAQRVLPAHFRTSNYSSFKHQLNKWGFRRITHNQYFHEMFLRGMPNLCHSMKRLSQADIRNQNRENKHLVLSQFHKFSNKYPILNKETISTDSKSKSDNSANSFINFDEIKKTNVMFRKSINTEVEESTLSKITKAELTAMLAMKQLSTVACA